MSDEPAFPEITVPYFDAETDKQRAKFTLAFYVLVAYRIPEELQRDIGQTIMNATPVNVRHTLAFWFNVAPPLHDRPTP